MPAVCEEVLFRGYILGTLENKFKKSSSIIVSSLLFGIFHMNFVSFFATTLLAVIIGIVVIKTKSLILGILIHFINNFFAVILHNNANNNNFKPINLSNDIYKLLLTLGLGIVLLLIGCFILMKGKKPEKIEV